MELRLQQAAPEGGQPGGGTAAPPTSPSYTPPTWAGVPEGWVRPPGNACCHSSSQIFAQIPIQVFTERIPRDMPLIRDPFFLPMPMADRVRTPLHHAPAPNASPLPPISPLPMSPLQCCAAASYVTQWY